MNPARLILLIGLLLAWLGRTAAWAEPPRRPNILFAIADDQSYPHAGAYGCPWVKTPGFDRVARQGLLFTRAYTPNAKCSPSRACILTGRNSWQLDAAANHIPFFPPQFKSFAEVLAESGYFVGYTGKGWAPGIAETADGKPRDLLVKQYQKKTLAPSTSEIHPIDYAGNFEDFLADRPADQPFFFWYGGFEPHRAYEYRSGIVKGGKTIEQVDRVPGFWPDGEVARTDLLDYAFEIEHFDLHLVRMLEMLEQRGELENTLVLVTADNGMPFPRVKGQEFEMSNHLPLAILWPRGIEQPGRAIDDYVSFIDFAPTFLELAGLEWDQTGMVPTPGRSLTGIFASDRSGRVEPGRDRVLIGKERHDVGRPHDGGYPIRGIVKDGWLYLRNFEPDRWPAGNPETGYLNTDGGPTKSLILDMRRKGEDTQFWQWSFGKRPAEQLYHIDEDPDCLYDLAGDSAQTERKRAMEQEMTDRLKAEGDPRMFGRGVLFDEYPYADAGRRNFYERFMRGELSPRDAGWVNPSDFEEKPGKE